MHALELLQNFAVFRYALVTGIAVGVVCSLLSVVVVLKRMAFIAQGVSHAGFGGLGLAIFFGLYEGRGQDLVVLGGCLATAILIGAIARRGRVQADSAIGIMLVAAMALGVLLTDAATTLRESRPAWYTAVAATPEARPPGFEQLLFGSILSVGWADMWVAVAVCLGVVLVLAAVFKELVFYAFDETVAEVCGVRTMLIHYLLLAVLSVVIVVAIRLVGVVLASALLVIPGATATLVSRRLGSVLLASLGVGLGGTVAGLLLSLELGSVSTGPCIVGVLCLAFGAMYGGRRVAGGGS